MDQIYRVSNYPFIEWETEISVSWDYLGKLTLMSVSNTSDSNLSDETADRDFMYSEGQEPKNILIPEASYFPLDVENYSGSNNELTCEVNNMDNDGPISQGQPSNENYTNDGCNISSDHSL